tara:strand:- start:3790 stop:5031 length:1242 start_codon:yes stop_codon:yes gene_type:complete
MSLDTIAAITPTHYEKTYRQLSWRLYAGTLLFYVSCIYLFPRIPGIPLRIEDLFFPLFLIIAILSLDGLPKKVTLPALLYCLYILIGSLVGILLQRIDIKGLSVSVKEIQYILGFFLLYSCCNKEQDVALKTIQSLVLVLWIPALYGCFMVVTNQIGYYGISALNEKSPSLSGQMYFSGFVLSLTLFTFFRGKSYAALALMMFVSASMVGSRTAVAMLLLFFLVRALKFNWKLVRFIVLFILFVYAASFLMGFYLDNFYDGVSVFDRSVRRANSLFSLQQSLAPRVDSWVEHRFHTDIRPVSALFGYGRGYENMLPDGTWRGFELNVDSQYIRDFFEIGLLGMVLKVSVFLIIASSMKGPYFNIFIAYLVCYAAAGVTMELFNLSKPGALFWLVAALCLVCSKFDPKIKDNNQ